MYHLGELPDEYDLDSAFRKHVMLIIALRKQFEPNKFAMAMDEEGYDDTDNMYYTRLPWDLEDEDDG